MGTVVHGTYFPRAAGQVVRLRGNGVLAMLKSWDGTHWVSACRVPKTRNGVLLEPREHVMSPITYQPMFLAGATRPFWIEVGMVLWEPARSGKTWEYNEHLVVGLSLGTSGLLVEIDGCGEYGDDTHALPIAAVLGWREGERYRRTKVVV